MIFTWWNSSPRFRVRSWTTANAVSFAPFLCELGWWYFRKIRLYIDLRYIATNRTRYLILHDDDKSRTFVSIWAHQRNLCYQFLHETFVDVYPTVVLSNCNILIVPIVVVINTVHVCSLLLHWFKHTLRTFLFIFCNATQYWYERIETWWLSFGASWIQIMTSGVC